ncbi:MAG: hypothetical protein FWD89_03400, partial [Firmicutes bacterium]|nr:hypothetical protein [Bacillota bacterium]
MKKLFIVSFILFVGVFLYGCRDGGSGGNFVPTQIVVERIEISHPQTNFPTIKLKNVSGQERTASVDDFWFVAENEYVFVQNGRIVITRDAPTTFIENLTITLRSNIQISTTVEVERLYVPVESLGFTINRHSFSILRGESAKLGVTFNPSHASNQNATFSIVSATVGYHNIHDYATITPEGFIEIDSFLEAGVVIKIRATVTGTDVYSDIDLEVRSRMPISAVSGANGFNTTLRNNPFGDFVLTADINLGSIVRWNPISIFHGTIEGNGHTISNIRIVETGRRLNSDLYLGLFG